MIIRRAAAADAEQINSLLFQVAKIHADGRPDIFKKATKKYSDEELAEIIRNDETPIFAAEEDGRILGYAFCVYQSTKGSLLMQDKKTLYIADICVDENHRGEHVGKSIFEYVEKFAKTNGFDNITLNVWAFNEGAYKFYENCGMTPLKTTMEKAL